MRVRFGTRSEEYPDIPLGGWSGFIADLDPQVGGVLYDVHWNGRTLAAMPSIYRTRCDRDDFDVESIWLPEENLEPDVGEPPPVEQPTELVPRPLHLSDPEDRVRKIFHLTSDDPLPDVSTESLRHFHRYLTENVRLPFRAIPDVLEPTPHRWTVRRLLPIEECDLDHGLLCEAVSEDGEAETLPLIETVPARNSKNHQLIGDYVQWFIDAEVSYSAGESLLPQSIERPSGLALVLLCAALGALYGGLLGGVIAVYDGAATGALVGAVVLALGSLAIVQGSNESIAVWPGKTAAILTGLILGGLLGALPGALVFAWQPALVGAATGFLLALLVPRFGATFVRTLVAAGLCGLLVPVVWGWYSDPGNAFVGTALGALSGAVGVPGLLALFHLVARIAPWRGPPAETDGSGE